MAFLTHNEIKKMGFLSIGENLQISDRASFYGVERIAIGNNVRIDDYCVLSAGLGGITIGNYVHIAAFSSLIGASKIILSDFCGLSSRVSIYSSNDDYSGASLTNPTVPDVHKKIQSSEVIIKKHVMLEEPLDESRGWNEAEDVEWSMRVRDKYVMKCNGKSVVRHNKWHRHAGPNPNEK